jgi:hypothetical protein
MEVMAYQEPHNIHAIPCLDQEKGGKHRYHM